ncbi:putative GIY-YIG type nuclease [Burkholderia phage FLC6]|nr:putative GIY-YIG type nuclease [Burkholderia phage FLC6]
MLIVDKEVDLSLWDAAGFFRLLSCLEENEIDEYKQYNDSLIGMRYLNIMPTQQNDISGVYVMYFKSNSKFYIGSSRKCAGRIAVHHNYMKAGRHQNVRIVQAYRENHQCKPEVIFIDTYTEERARHVEQRLIDLVFLDPYCLNQRQMVEEYRPSTESTREKLQSSAKRQWQDPNFKKKIKKIYSDPNHRERRIANGKKLTEDPEYMKKLSDASKKLWEDPEYAEKIKRSGSAVWDDEAFKERHKAAMKAKWADPEYKARVVGKRAEAQRKPVTINGVQYSHAKAAAQALGMSETSVRRKCDK